MWTAEPGQWTTRDKQDKANNKVIKYFGITKVGGFHMETPAQNEFKSQNWNKSHIWWKKENRNTLIAKKADSDWNS